MKKITTLFLSMGVLLQSSGFAQPDTQEQAFIRDENGYINALEMLGTQTMMTTNIVNDKAGYQFGSTLEEGVDTAISEEKSEPSSCGGDYYCDGHLYNRDSTVTAKGYRTVGRLYYYKSSGNYVPRCSATVIAPRVVLTAANCVYDNGKWYNSGMRFYPALRADGSAPYGFGVVTQVLYWSSWVSDENYNNDMAALLLDRPVGAIVGTTAYTSDYVADDYYTWPFLNYGYPIAFGNSLYSLDTYVEDEPGATEVTTYQAETRFKDEAKDIFYDLTGMQGAGLAFMNCQQSGDTYACSSAPYRLNAVLSRWEAYIDPYNKNGCTEPSGCYLWYGHNTRITSNKENDIKNYITSSVPASYDYWPLYLHMGTIESPATYVAWTRGQTYQVEYLIHNNSSQNGTDVFISTKFYLSKDGYIGTADDILLKEVSGAWDIAALGTVSEDEAFSIPTSVAKGTYYLGAVFTIEGDYNTSNNKTNGRDFLKIDLN